MSGVDKASKAIDAARRAANAGKYAQSLSSQTTAQQQAGQHGASEASRIHNQTRFTSNQASQSAQSAEANFAKSQAQKGQQSGQQQSGQQQQNQSTDPKDKDDDNDPKDPPSSPPRTMTVQQAMYQFGTQGAAAKTNKSKEPAGSQLVGADFSYAFLKWGIYSNAMYHTVKFLSRMGLFAAIRAAIASPKVAGSGLRSMFGRLAGGIVGAIAMTMFSPSALASSSKLSPTTITRITCTRLVQRYNQTDNIFLKLEALMELKYVLAAYQAGMDETFDAMIAKSGERYRRNPSGEQQLVNETQKAVKAYHDMVVANARLFSDFGEKADGLMALVTKYMGRNRKAMEAINTHFRPFFERTRRQTFDWYHTRARIVSDRAHVERYLRDATALAAP